MSQGSKGASSMAFTSTILGAVHGGHVTALRATAVVADAMSAIGKYCSNQLSRAPCGPQGDALAAAIEVEILLASWRARHQPPEQEPSRRLCACSIDGRAPS